MTGLSETINCDGEPCHKGPEFKSPQEEIVVHTQYGNLSRCRELVLEYGVDVNRPDTEGCYLLHWAAINNRVDLIEFYLSHGAIVDQIGGDLQASPLHWAVRSGHLHAVITLIRHGADPLIADKEGLNCVMVAAAFEHAHVLSYILAKYDHTFDINVRDNEGRSAALWASCRNNQPDVMRLLLAYGANLNVYDSQLRSPLHWAAFISSYWTLQLIIKSNHCDPTRRDNQGQTALNYAEETRMRVIYQSVDAYEYRYRCRTHGRGSVDQGLLKSIWKTIRNDEGLQCKIVVFLPALFYLFVGLVLEYSMSYWLKATLIFVCCYGLFWVGTLCANSDKVVRLIPISLSFGTKFWLYSSYFALSYPMQSSHPLVEICFWSLIFLAYFFFAKSVLSDPGVLTKGDKDVFSKKLIERAETVIKTDPSYKMEDFCFTCLLRRPLRSKHCSACDRCLARFDHHCPWVANCVALKNLKFFLCYLFFLGINLVWDMYGNVIYAVSRVEEPIKWDSGFWSAIGIAWTLACASPWAAWNYINATSYGIGVIVLLCCQIYQACRNLTSNERLRHFKYKHFRDPKTNKFKNPFSRGCIQNFVDSVGVGIPRLIQPSPIDWKRCYSIQEVYFQSDASPSKLA